MEPHIYARGATICPVCRAPLRAQQTVCSARCRVRRWRQELSRRRDEALVARTREIREMLEAALRKLEEGSP